MKRNKTILAASTSLLAAGMAQGSVVYHYVNQSFDPNGSFQFDLNGDGTNDFNVFFDAANAAKPCVVGTYVTSGAYPGSFPTPTPYVFNELDMNAGYPDNPGGNDNNGAPVIPVNTVITNQVTVGAYTVSIGDLGGDQHGKNEAYLSQNGETTVVGQWPSGQDTVGYVGLALVDTTATPAITNYGWVQLDLDYTQPTAKLTVIDYAYQDSAGISVATGENGLTYPVIFRDPTNQTAVAGSTVTMSVLATGNPAPTFQWKAGAVNSGVYTNLPNAGNFSGANTPNLTIANVAPANQLDYMVLISNVHGSTNSPAATLTVLGAAVAGPFPDAQVIYSGYPAHFTVSDLGGGTITNRWQRNDSDLSDGTDYTGVSSTNLMITSVTPADTGNYRANVSTSYGSVNSGEASLGIAFTDGSSYEAAVRSYGATEYYRLNETSGTRAWDFIGGKTGTYGTDAVLGNPGPNPSAGFSGFADTNDAATFDQLDKTNYITLPPWNLNANTVTLTAWIYPQFNQGNAGIVFTAGVGSMVCGIRYDGSYLSTNGIDDGDIGYSWNNDFADGTWDSGITAPHNVWSLVALSVSSTNAALYIINDVNGVQSSVHVNNHDPAPFNATECIGAYPLEGTNVFNGFIDEVAIFKSTLSSNQIYSLYASAHGAVVPPSVSIAQTGSSALVRWTSGTLLQSTNVVGPWITNTAAVSPYNISLTNAQMFFRVQQ